MTITPITALDRAITLVEDRRRKLAAADGGPAWLVVQRERELEEAIEELHKLTRKETHGQEESRTNTAS